MPWTVGGTTFDLEARHGRPVLINGEGAATTYDDEAAGLQQLLERERFQLIAVSRLNHETVGELVGFDGTRLLVGLTPGRAPRFLSFAWFRRLLR